MQKKINIPILIKSNDRQILHKTYDIWISSLVEEGVIFFIICSSLSFIILFLSISITVSAPYSEKSSSYKCGFDSYGDARNMFDDIFIFFNNKLS
jgi:hypothetical protein